MFWPSYPLTQAKTTQYRQNKRVLRTSYDSIVSQAKTLCLILPYSTNLIINILLIMYGFIPIVIAVILVLIPDDVYYKVIHKAFKDTDVKTKLEIVFAVQICLVFSLGLLALFIGFE